MRSTPTYCGSELQRVSKCGGEQQQQQKEVPYKIVEVDGDNCACHAGLLEGKEMSEGGVWVESHHLNLLDEFLNLSKASWGERD